MNTQPESNLVKMTGIILPGEKNPLIENIAEELHLSLIHIWLFWAVSLKFTRI